MQTYNLYLQLTGPPISPASETQKNTANMPSTTANAAHILVFPYPAQGHLIPILDLTHHLLLRGLTVTIVVTTNNRHLLEPLLSSHPTSAVSALVLSFPPHPSLPAGAENTKDLPPNSFVPVMSTLRRLRQPLLRWFTTHPSPPSAILSDMFLGWTHQLAVQLSIKRFVFSPSGALALSVINSLWSKLPKLPLDENDVIPFDDIPGQPRFKCHELSDIYRSYASAVPESEFLRGEFLNNLSSYGFVINTFDQLEADYLTHIKKELGHDRVWAVGPVLPPDSDVSYGPKMRGWSGSCGDDDVLSWLDGCGDDEVIYVCFGSQAVLTNGQMEALAGGLERSGARFVWKIKEPSNGHVEGERFGKLPPGFEDRVAGRGLVIRGWAPQVLILRHRAVCAFLTHCGWNSVLEGLSAGVMMLAWPLGADQYSDAVLLVDNLKVGLRVGQGTKSLPDPDELGRILAESVSGACKEHRLRALELKKMAKEAVSEGGSSSMELDGFVHHLSQLPKPDENAINECKKWLDEHLKVVN
ncbi:hypothetical protein V2J09_020422 [Rumex salicifolius]